MPRPSGLPRMSDETRKLIRRMALAAMVAVGKKHKTYSIIANFCRFDVRLSPHFLEYRPL